MTTRKGPQHSIVPAAAATETRFVGCDLQVLLLLGRHTDRDGWCRRRQRVMGEELGRDRVTVLRSLQRLEALGYVESKPMRGEHGGNASKIYRIVAPKAQAELFDSPCGVDATGPCGVDATTPESSARLSPCGVQDATSRTTPKERPLLNGSEQRRLPLMRVIEPGGGASHDERRLTQVERTLLAFRDIARRQNGSDR